MNRLNACRDGGILPGMPDPAEAGILERCPDYIFNLHQIDKMYSLLNFRLVVSAQPGGGTVVPTNKKTPPPSGTKLLLRGTTPLQPIVATGSLNAHQQQSNRVAGCSW
ncbi:MAG: hypothetical protein ACLFVO_28330 [Chloroflexaceae bacterium]